MTTSTQPAVDNTSDNNNTLMMLNSTVHCSGLSISEVAASSDNLLVNCSNTGQQSPMMNKPNNDDSSPTAKDDYNSYRVFVNDRHLNAQQRKRGPLGIKLAKFSHNHVTTTKYTWWNFIFLNIFNQLRNLSNIYFLLALIFALVPGVSPTTPIAQLQIILIIIANIIRDGGEDFLRYLNDRKVNRKITNILNMDGVVQKIHTSKVRVGDIVRVECDETVPADMIVLTSCHCEHANGKISLSSNCKIETANLDGETNLKSRFGILNETVSMNEYETKESVLIKTLLQLKGSVECEKPNENLHTFKGSALLNSESSAETNLIPINQQHLLLKGTILKATEYVYGLVVYCGKDTKIMRNMQKGKRKFTSMSFALNIMIAILFIIMCCLCITFASVSSHFEFTLAKISTYTGKSSLKVTNAASVILSMMTFFILFNSLIPISLFITLEVVRMFQAWLVNKDNEMSVYDVDPHDPVSKKVLISSSSLSSELLCDLATVDIIFSDKTGTLTENSMVFNKLCIGNGYIHDDKINTGKLKDLIEQSLKEPLKEVSDHALVDQKPIIGENQNLKEKCCLSQDELFQALNTMLLLSLCHNVDVRVATDAAAISEAELMENVEEKRPFYEGGSVDEISLVHGAFNNGFKLKFFSEQKTIVSIFKKEYTFERLCEIPFTPDRKRMSTIFKISKEFLSDFPVYRNKASNCIQNGVGGEETLYVCFTKGADSFLFPFMEENEVNQTMKGKVEENILELAKEGLRTLLLAYKFIPNQSAVDEFVTKYNELKSKQDVQQEILDKMENEMEMNLQILGATGIEDSLQDKVPETVKFFLDAGVQLWMLTGDKTETAINIAGVSNFIDRETRLIHIRGDEFKNGDECSNVLHSKNKEIGEETNVAIVIDGLGLTFCVENAILQDQFFEMVRKCKTVICCRATPKQKALLVGIAQRKLKKKGLAIGDGANDVPMIHKAKIGVGIIGKEGSQAKLSADFAIPRFHMLRKLLAVHGRYSFKRCSKHIFYSFYKNISVTCLQIYFTFYAMYSGQTLVNGNIIGWWNLFFTLWNTMVFGWMDKDIHESKLLDAKLGPRLYASLKRENIFNLYVFLRWTASAVAHSLIIFFVVLYGTQGSIFANGQDSDSLWLKSLLVGSSMYCVVNFKCYLEMEGFTIVNHFFMIFSFAIFYGYSLILEFNPRTIPVLVTDTMLSRVWSRGSQSAVFWFVHILCVVGPLSLDFAGHSIKWLFWPDEYQKVKSMKVPKIPKSKV